MPRHNHVARNLDGSITMVIDSVAHTMTEAAFIAFMEAAINTLQAIAALQHKPSSRQRS